MLQREIIIRAHKSHIFSRQRVDIHIGAKENGEVKDIATDIIFKEYDFLVDSPPLFSISETHAQAFMDELWECGLRPTEGTGSAGSLEATVKHLNDMRKIVFDKLGIE